MSAATKPARRRRLACQRWLWGRQWVHFDRMLDERRAEPTTEPTTVKLYHFPTSLCSQKVRLALEEKGVTWESAFINIGPAFEQYEPWYVELNERMVVPTLVLSEPGEPRIITDSAKILRTIDGAFDGPPLIPADAEDRAQMDRWIDLQQGLALREFSYARLRGVVGWILRRSLSSRRKRLAKLQKRHPELTRAYAKKMADLEQWRSTVANTEAIREIEGDIERCLDEMELVLSTREHLAGPYSLADIAWTVLLARLAHLGYASLWEQGARPHVDAYFARMRARPSFSEATNTLDNWQRLRLLARVILPKLVMAWLIKVAVFWCAAELFSLWVG